MTSKAYRDNFDLIEWHQLPEQPKVQHRSARSALPAPRVIGDCMDPVQSMLDGKMYDSKSALRETYRAAGVTEVGNDSSIVDPKPFRKPDPPLKEIRASVERAFSRAGWGA